jgi:hypothetical protein
MINHGKVTPVGEAVITCTTCGTRQVFHGSKWETAVEAEVWLKQHQRAEHTDKQAPALPRRHRRGRG